METMIGYDFQADGRYDQKYYLDTQQHLDTFMHTHVVRAFMEGREAMVTDSGDNAVFHVKGGKVEWAGGGDIQEMTSTLRALGVKQNDLQAKLRDSLEKSRQTIGYRLDGMER